jgi:ATP synthase I chain
VTESEDLDRSADRLPVPAAPLPYVLSSEIASSDVLTSETVFDRVVPRLLRNILVISGLLLVPALWFYDWAGLIGFVFGGTISYINFRSLTRGVEGLADRIVNKDSQEKGAVIVFRFVVRYVLVAAAAYAIFVSSFVAFRGFLWGLCVPVAALMVEALWLGLVAFRSAS